MPHAPDWFRNGLPHIWQPYTQMKGAPDPLPVVGAEGSYIHLADGTRLLDGTAAWWSMCHGYQHPDIVKAITRQAETLCHSMFAGLAHQPAYELAARLCALAPEGINHCFYSDSGSTAVEVALKMALQYWKNQGKPRKSKLICFQNGYHGDTFGAMSVSSRNGIHSAFDSLTLRNYVLELPTDEYSMAECAETIAAIADQTAALIIEPLVQGAGGMRFHSPDILAEIRRICREQNILFIADEVMTGFYRTGSLFACNEAAITPDIICLGKALTGGHAPLAATLATAKVFEGFLGDDPSSALMHGPTFMAHPLGCAAANASLALFAEGNYSEKVERIEAQLHERLHSYRHPLIAECRVKGAIGVIELCEPPSDMAALRAAFVQQGVWIRPFGNVIYLLPPLTISQEELESLLNGVMKTLATIS